MTDCELFCDKFTRNTASILFTKLKGRYSANVCLASFKPCVDMIAEIKECERCVVLRKMRDTHGPKFSKTTVSSPKNSPTNSGKVDEVIRDKRRQTVKF